MKGSAAVMELWHTLRDVPGWLEREEAELLCRLARTAGPGRIVELGAFQGRSSIALAAGLRARSHATADKLLVIDTFRGSGEHQPGQPYFDEATFDRSRGRIDTFPLFRRNLQRFGLDGIVDAWQCTTQEAAERFTGTIALLFVDADHEYRAVSEDLAAWTAYLAAYGRVVIHDVGEWEGPTRAAADLLAAGYCRIEQAGSALVLGRKGAST